VQQNRSIDGYMNVGHLKTSTTVYTGVTWPTSCASAATTDSRTMH